jgi:uroporphyrinogen-III synthase
LGLKTKVSFAHLNGKIMADELPLRGLKIVVTRPRDQAVELARSIEQAGGIPLLFPLLEITAVQDTRSLHELISRLAQFDLAIFISPNAVQYGIGAIREIGTIPEKLKIATVGQGSARALRDLGVANVIAPTERFDSEGLLALPELQHVAGWNVVIFRGDGGRELLGDTLRQKGATLEYATCYQRSKPQLDPGILLTGEPDAILVTSSEALVSLRQMLDAAPGVLRNMTIFLPHPRIAELALQQGWSKVQLTESGDEGMLSALKAWAVQKTLDKKE